MTQGLRSLSSHAPTHSRPSYKNTLLQNPNLPKFSIYPSHILLFPSFLSLHSHGVALPTLPGSNVVRVFPHLEDVRREKGQGVLHPKLPMLQAPQRQNARHRVLRQAHQTHRKPGPQRVPVPPQSHRQLRHR